VAYAQSQRTFVASTGNDSNACSLVSPCRGFARAITQTAANGTIGVLDSAGYGPVAIDRSVSIVAPGGVYAGITALTGDGVTISTDAINVTLRGLNITLHGGSRGVYINGMGTTVNIDSCVVANAFGSGIEVNANLGRLVVRDTIVRGGVGPALMVAGGVAEVDGSRIEENQGPGIVVYNARMSVNRTTIATNAGDGLWVVGSVGFTGVGTDVSVDSSVLADNGGSGIFLSAGGPGYSARVGVSRSTLARNQPAGIFVESNDASTVYLSANDNRVEGNLGYGVYLQQCGAGGYANLSRNVVVSNPNGFLMGAPSTPTCVFRSSGDNVVRDNIVDLTGTITKVPGD
jgi:hypothetical protein